MTDTTLYLKSRRFILQRARPIDHARWRFHFEQAPVDAVLNILAQYQNGDGGFGHGLEADFWNPLSSPMQTWAATELIQSLNFANPKHPIVLGILHYLESQVDFNGDTWQRTIPSNNAYPHAEWWEFQGDDQAIGYNPTASLAGFALQFSAIDSELHRLARRIAEKAFQVLLAAPTVELHELSCFQRLLDCTIKSGVDLRVDLAAVSRKIGSLINGAITRDTSQWSTGYVCRPSRFIRSRTDQYFPENQDITTFECQFLKNSQLEDGSWPVNWQWSGYPDAWPIAKEWWKSTIIIENLLFVRGIEIEAETEGLTRRFS